jgi:hypothetical protein
MIPSKGFRSGKILLRTLILVHIIKVTCVIISCELWYNRRDTCQMAKVKILKFTSQGKNKARQ